MMERYDIRVNVWGDVSGPQYEWETVRAEDGDFVLYADAQATVEALQRERDELKELTSVICGHCCEPMAIPSKAVLQAALDAERERSEKQAEEAMVVFSKLSQLQALVRAYLEARKSIDSDLAEQARENLKHALDATTPAPIDAAETHDRMFNHADRHPEAL